jgi:hypothetical protein
VAIVQFRGVAASLSSGSSTCRYWSRTSRIDSLSGRGVFLLGRERSLARPRATDGVVDTAFASRPCSGDRPNGADSRQSMGRQPCKSGTRLAITS